MNLDEVCRCGDSRDLDCTAVPGGNQVKGAGPLAIGGAKLKIRTCLGLEKASCGVEAKRASLRGFESPSPHQYHTHGRSCFSHLQCAEGDFRSISIFDFAFDKHGRLTRNSKLLEGFV